FFVAFTFEGKHGVWSCFDTTGNSPREVNSEEGKARIGDRVDQIPHQIAARRNDFVVLAAERDNLQSLRISGQPHDAIAVKSAAVDREIRLNRAARRLKGDLSRISLDAFHSALRQDLPTAGLYK